MGTITERVAKGAAFLDEHDPHWWKEIDLEILDVSEPDRCILGQRCPLAVLADYCSLPADDEDLSAEAWRAYTAYAEKLSGITADAPNFEALAQWGDDHGFSNSDTIGGWEGYSGLTAEWHRIIVARRDSLT